MKDTNRNSIAGQCANHGKTILVVEDNPQALKLLSLYLTQAGYEVLTAANGTRALELAEKYCPIAITLDLLLPDRDGWEVLTELKASSRTREIPVVIISVLDRQSLGFQLGASEYLTKPVERTELLQVLRRFIPHVQLNQACRKVMVVHSDPDELNLLSMILVQENYEVIQAPCAKEAVDLAKQLHPDLVVINLLASGIDCFTLLEELKSSPETGNIPVLALTHLAFTTEERTHAGGVVEFVLMQDNELIEERLLAAITLLFKRESPE